MTYSDPERKKIAWKKWYAKNRKHRINYIAMQRKTYPERWRNYDRRAYLRRRDQKLAFAKEYRVKNRALVIARKWGIDAGDVSKVLQASSSCDVCGSTKRLSVDHDHKTKMVRGLLCGKCNSALGMAQEDKDILRGLVQYLERV